MDARVTVRDIHTEEFAALGQLLVEVYSSLPGFPSPLELRNAEEHRRVHEEAWR
jgi:hypothetical protein